MHSARDDKEHLCTALIEHTPYPVCLTLQEQAPLHNSNTIPGSAVPAASRGVGTNEVSKSKEVAYVGARLRGKLLPKFPANHLQELWDSCGPRPLRSAGVVQTIKEVGYVMLVLGIEVDGATEEPHAPAVRSSLDDV